MECTIKELQAKLLEMIVDFDKFCQDNNIRYTLCGGNVLGAVRHKGFIPWDDDIDVYLTRENYDKLLNTFQNNEKYYLQKEFSEYPMHFSKLRLNNTTFLENIPYTRKCKNIHQGMFIDIFPIDKVSNNKFKTKMQIFIANIVIAQSLYLRGYSKKTLQRKVVSTLCFILRPFRKLMIKYVKSYNKLTENFRYCDIYGSIKKVFFDPNDFDGDLPKLPYENIELPVMNNYIDYLIHNYDENFMTLPSEKEREAHIHAKYVNLNESYEKYIN